jgi:hypothetical protein
MTDNIRPPADSRTSASQTESSVTSYTSCTLRDAWTPAGIEERLRKAAALRETLVPCDAEFAAAGESIGIIGVIGVADVGAASDAVVAEAAEALSWLHWLNPDDAGIVTARLDRAPWKAICWRFGISRPTADRRWRYALTLIAWRLNGHAASPSIPSLRSLLRRRRASGSGRVPVYVRRSDHSA